MAAETSFPESRAAFSRLIGHIRSIISMKLLDLAVDVAPDVDDEKLSAAIAVHDHLQRMAKKL